MLRFKINEVLRIWERKLEPLNVVEVDKKRIVVNYLKYTEMNKGEIWPVLKGNAYGVGIGVAMEVLKEVKPRYVVVDSYMEALEVWQVQPDQSILLIGTNCINNLKLFDFRRVTLMVQNMEEILELKRLNRKVKIHLKLNSGMNRQGFDEAELKNLKNELVGADKIEAEGVMSHLPMGSNFEETEKQEKKFLKMVDFLDLKPQFLHLGATEGVISVRSKRINAFRVGVGLFRGVIGWKSTIVKVRKVERGGGSGVRFIGDYERIRLGGGDSGWVF